MNFDKHVNHLTAKIAQHSGILYKLMATLNEKQLIQYIRSFISPLVQYDVLLYGLGPKTELHKNFSYSKKVIMDSFMASRQDPRYRKIQRLKNRNSVRVSCPRNIRGFT